MSGKPVLYIIHGWTYTVEPWEKTIALLEKSGFRVEMLHVPGLTSPSKKVWTIDDYVEWAAKQIPDGAVALGHSNGGRILLNLCVKYPEKLSHLILLDSAGVYEASAKRDLSRTLSKALGFLKKVPGLEKLWHKIVGASDYAKAPENMKHTLTNMLESDKSLKLYKVSTPTSILWGAEDTVTPPRQAKIIHEKIPHSTLSIYPGWNHAPYISHPGELAKAIVKAYKNPPALPAEPDPDTNITKAAAVSASLALKKAAEPEVKSTADVSAALSLKKASGPVAESSTKKSAALAVPSKNQKFTPISGLEDVDYEAPALPRQIISTASVPKKRHGRRAQK